MDAQRIEHLRENWSAETSEGWTEEWREDLTPEEYALVESWDDAFFAAYNIALRSIPEV